MDIERDSIPVEEMIISVKRAVAQAGLSRLSPDRDLRVDSVELTLRVVAARQGGAGLSFRVPFIGVKLSGGAAVSKQNTHTVSIALRPAGGPSGQVVRGGPMQEALANAIKTVRTAMASAADGDDPWALSASTVDLEFAVERTGRISLGAEGELTDEATHTLRLALLPSLPSDSE